MPKDTLDELLQKHGAHKTFVAKDPLLSIPKLMPSVAGKASKGGKLPRNKWHEQGEAIKEIFKLSQEEKLRKEILKANGLDVLSLVFEDLEGKIATVEADIVRITSDESMHARLKLMRYDQAQKEQRQEIFDLKSEISMLHQWQKLAAYALKNVSFVAETREMIIEPTMLERLLNLLVTYEPPRLALLQLFVNATEGHSNEDLVADGRILPILLRLLNEDDWLTKRYEMGQTSPDNVMCIVKVCHQFAMHSGNRVRLERDGVTQAMNFTMKNAQGKKKEGDNNKLILLALKVNSLITPPLPKAKPIEALEVHQAHIEWDWPSSLV